MPSIEEWRLRSALAGLALIAGCSAPAPKPGPALVAPSPAPVSAQEAGAARPARVARLPPPLPVSNHRELSTQAAMRMLAANPEATYSGEVLEPLLAIPVLEIELNADGSIRHIVKLRMPTQAQDTAELAAEAVRRAAPFGDVSHLPRPWRFTETFLFNYERKFKPRTLDE